jgi:hypothetical protein
MQIPKVTWISCILIDNYEKRYFVRSLLTHQLISKYGKLPDQGSSIILYKNIKAGR